MPVQPSLWQLLNDKSSCCAERKVSLFFATPCNQEIKTVVSNVSHIIPVPHDSTWMFIDAKCTKELKITVMTLLSDVHFKYEVYCNIMRNSNLNKHSYRSTISSLCWRGRKCAKNTWFRQIKQPIKIVSGDDQIITISWFISYWNHAKIAYLLMKSLLYFNVKLKYKYVGNSVITVSCTLH